MVWLCFAGLGTAQRNELRLIGANLALAHPGEWTGLTIILENTSGVEESCEIELQIGDVTEGGLHAFRYPLTIPAGMQLVRKFPVVMPAHYDPKAEAAAKQADNKGGGRKIPAIRPKPKSIPFEARLKQQGVVLTRAQYLAPILQEEAHYIGQDLFDPSGMDEEKILPLPRREGYFWQSKQGEFSGVSKRIHTTRRTRAPGDVVMPWERNFQKVQIVSDLPLSAYEEEDLLDWASRGGLLILEPCREGRTWNEQLEFSLEDDFLTALPPEVAWLETVRLAEPTRVAKALRHAFSKEWTLLWTDAGEPLGAYRPWRNGRVMVSNLPLEYLVGSSEAVEKKMLEIFYPHQSAFAQVESSQFMSQLSKLLDVSNGFKVWPRSWVSIYLLSFLWLSGGMIFLPVRKLRGEWRWYGWIGMVLVWSLAAILLLMMTGDTSTRVVETRLNISQAEEGERTVRQIGMLSLVSGQKRYLDLNMPLGLNWDHEQRPSISKRLEQGDRHLVWKDVSLLPGQALKISYTGGSSLQMVEPRDVTLAGDRLKFRLDSVKPGLSASFIVGRRVWNFVTAPEIELSVDSGHLLKAQDNVLEWQSLLLAAGRGTGETLDINSRVWMVVQVKDVRPTLELPASFESVAEDIQLVETKLSFAPGQVVLAPGMFKMRFIKGRINIQEKASFKEFDGTLFEKLQEGTSVEVVFRPPAGCENIVPESLELYVDILPPPGTEIGVEVFEKGRHRKLKVPLEGTTPLDLSAWENGSLRVKVSTPTRMSASMVHKHWEMRGLGLGMKGVIQ